MITENKVIGYMILTLTVNGQRHQQPKNKCI